MSEIEIKDKQAQRIEVLRAALEQIREDTHPCSWREPGRALDDVYELADKALKRTEETS